MFKSRLLIFPPGHLFCTLNMAPFTESEAKTASWQKRNYQKKKTSGLTTQATHWVRETKAPSLTPRPPAPPHGQQLLNRGEPAATVLWETSGLSSPLRPAPLPPPRYPRPVPPPPLAPPHSSAAQPPAFAAPAAHAGAFRTPTHTSNALFSPEKFLDGRDYFLLM